MAVYLVWFLHILQRLCNWVCVFFIEFFVVLNFYLTFATKDNL